MGPNLQLLKMNYHFHSIQSNGNTLESNSCSVKGGKTKPKNCWRWGEFSTVQCNITLLAETFFCIFNRVMVCMHGIL
uniref:Uncharacterized protein n=1 Tax=Periophthalmus magnuspinnatus TaxID=409849 RepID=A0A3B3ZS54_9GOBI